MGTCTSRIGGAGKVLLHESVFARVVRQHDAATARGQGRHGVVEGGAKQLQLLVDRDPQRLEHPLCRMSPAMAGGPGNRVADEVGELHRRRDRTRDDNRPGDAASKTTFTVVGEQPGEVVFGRVVDDVCGRGTVGRVHAHVERGVESIRETPASLVELPRAHAEVEEDPRDWLAVGHVCQDGSDAVEACSHDDGSSAERRKGGPCRSNRLGITVEADKAMGCRGGKHSGGMTPASDRGVENHAARR